MNRLPFWLTLAIDELGVKEVPGLATNPRIAEYLETVGMPGNDEIAWCSAFMNWDMKMSFIKGTGSPMARSWCTWGIPVELRRGAVVVFKRGDNPIYGHVSLALDFSPGENLVYCIGGNQRNRVAVTAYPTQDIVAIRWPKWEE